MGFGHFQINDALFFQLRTVLREDGHQYVDGHKFGGGPNWRIRVLRVGLEAVGLNSDEILKHGIQREVYAMPIAVNSREFLVGKDKSLVFNHMSVEEISDLAKARWVVPRSERNREYLGFHREQLISNLTGPVGEPIDSSCLDERRSIPRREYVKTNGYR